MSINDRLKEAKQRLILAQGGDIEAIEQQTDKKTAETLQKYGLNLDQATDNSIKRANAHSIQKIRSDLAGNGLIKAGLTFSGNATERAQLGYLSALVEQGWILARQNELIIRSLEKIAEK